MTDTPEQAKVRHEFEAAQKKSLASLEQLRAAFAELERTNHPKLAWAREVLQRAETAYEVLTNTIATAGHIDPEDLSAFVRSAKAKW